jgi:hypothetical protein
MDDVQMGMGAAQSRPETPAPQQPGELLSLNLAMWQAMHAWSGEELKRAAGEKPDPLVIVTNRKIVQDAQNLLARAAATGRARAQAPQQPRTRGVETTGSQDAVTGQPFGNPMGGGKEVSFER